MAWWRALPAWAKFLSVPLVLILSFLSYGLAVGMIPPKVILEFRLDSEADLPAPELIVDGVQRGKPPFELDVSKNVRKQDRFMTGQFLKRGSRSLLSPDDGDIRWRKAEWYFGGWRVMPIRIDIRSEARNVNVRVEDIPAWSWALTRRIPVKVTMSENTVWHFSDDVALVDGAVELNANGIAYAKLTPKQAESLNQVIRKLSVEFMGLEIRHARFLWKGNRLQFLVQPFPKEGAELRERFQGALDSIIPTAQERRSAFLAADGHFFSGFGDYRIYGTLWKDAGGYQADCSYQLGEGNWSEMHPRYAHLWNAGLTLKGGSEAP